MSPVWIPVVAIVGGIGFAAFGMYLRFRAREMAHRERLAMIERGMVPSPEQDPKRFDEFMERHDIGPDFRRNRGPWSGVPLMFIGLGIGLMIALTSRDGSLARGVGIGGLIFLVGLGSSVANMLRGRYSPPNAPRVIDGDKKPSSGV